MRCWVCWLRDTVVAIECGDEALSRNASLLLIGSSALFLLVYVGVASTGVGATRFSAAKFSDASAPTLPFKLLLEVSVRPNLLLPNECQTLALSAIGLFVLVLSSSLFTLLVQVELRGTGCGLLGGGTETEAEAGILSWMNTGGGNTGSPAGLRPVPLGPPLPVTIDWSLPGT